MSTEEPDLRTFAVITLLDKNGKQVFAIGATLTKDEEDGNNRTIRFPVHEFVKVESGDQLEITLYRCPTNQGEPNEP